MPIRRLPDTLVRHIAAGEVVERPASIVKELLENSLDAGATRVLIELSDGGLSGIRITDDGSGIATDDLPQLLHRHATSKISTEADLHAITTLGFRGEALYAISAVTRFCLRTRRTQDEVGAQLTRSDEEGLVEQPWAGPAGTTIEARDLFYNLPARRKFLKGAAAEFARVAELAGRYALAYPLVSLELRHNDRRSFHAHGTGAHDALLALFGQDLAGRLLPIDWMTPGLRVLGHLSPPGLMRSTRKDQTVFVNGRWVRDQGLQLAIERAYGRLLGEGRHPIAVIRVEIAPEEVDVNVHPHKTEVRFADSRAVIRGVQRACEAALGSALLSMPSTSEPPAWELEYAELPALPPIQARLGLSLESAPSLPEFPPDFSDDIPLTVDDDTGEVTSWAPTALTELAPAIDPPAEFAVSLDLREGTVIQHGASLAIIEVGEDLYALHLPRLRARVLYDQLQSSATGAPSSQTLMFPLSLSLGAAEAELLESLTSVFTEFGFAFDASGAIVAVPTCLAAVDPAEIVSSVLEGLVAGDESREASGEDLRARLAERLATQASRGARGAVPLEELRRLLAHLTDYRSWTTPGGQPIVLKWTPAWFGRLFGA
ncbi:MAG: DNA mismatch repair endonuclease MutL [bacterium]